MRSSRQPHWVIWYILVVLMFTAAALSCSTTRNALARWGGAATGAALGTALAGPAGAAVGAVAGDAGGDALVADPPTTTINNAPGGTVYTQEATPGASLLRYWPWALAGWLLLRFRRHLWGAASTLATGGWGAFLANLGAVVVGGAASDNAKQATAVHAERRAGRRLRFQSPVKVTVQPHDSP